MTAHEMQIHRDRWLGQATRLRQQLAKARTVRASLEIAREVVEALQNAEYYVRRLEALPLQDYRYHINRADYLWLQGKLAAAGREDEKAAIMLEDAFNRGESWATRIVESYARQYNN